MSSTNGVPVAEGLFAETATGPRLLGSRCTTCKTPYFPKSPVCHNPSCDKSVIEAAEFGPTGTLWSFAVQDYPPPAPAKFDEPYEPYAMAVVDLDDGLRVLGRVSTEDPHAIEVGAKVELVIEPLCHREDGTPLLAWKFKVRANQ